MLLEALKRHLSTVALLPGFFDLMTQSPALDQPIISFLAKELENRDNLGLVCAPLHDAARQLGFDWSHDGVEYYSHFRARLFDNRRNVVRRWDGVLQHATPEIPPDDPRRMTIESAARFNSQIPLEYAYAIWGRLPDDPQQSGLLRPFRAVSAAHLTGFAAHRLRALAHIEQSFKLKARFLQKHPIELSSLAAGSAPDASLVQCLSEFLFMEHHAAFQAKLQVYGLAMRERMQLGLGLLLRCSGALGDDTYRFDVAFDQLGLDPVLTLNALRLKEGDWVVVNPANPPRSANQIKNGRLAVVKSIEATAVVLRLLRLTSHSGRFKYYHDTAMQPDLGAYYAVDQMADDLNADKTLAALHNVSSNTLYHWLEQTPPRRPHPDGLSADVFLDLINQLERPYRLTLPQRRVICGHQDQPLLLVQGPPGTGKSHTIGWAILYRMVAAAAQGRPCRVAVSCKTHNAVNIVLDSVARKLRKLAAFRLPQIPRQLMAATVYKLVNDEDGDGVPDGVTALSPYNSQAKLEDMLSPEFVVIGATPGGFYNLARYRKVGGKGQIDWDYKSFDLLVVDEASQMSVPEAVLAGAFIKPDGSMLVVGDHRQMPPIVAHAWEEEERRSVRQAEPYLSFFESLMQRDFASESLDESFRLHTVIARFLQDNIYVHDGIEFFSKRRDLLTAVPPVNPFVDAVMDPAYPIVVVEHAEASSQQFNATELEIVSDLMTAVAAMRLDGMDGVGVVVPHRAQKAILRQRFPALGAQNAIDTVERFQGGERDMIIVSATASDPGYVLAEADFLLNLNRLNVALSRPRKKLVVVASRSVTHLLVSDLDVFENAMVWKRLFYQYAGQVLWSGSVNGVPVIVRGCGADGRQ